MVEKCSCKKETIMKKNFEANKVVLIDDDEYTLSIYKMLLEWSGLSSHFSTYASAADAIKDLENQQNFPDYILLDINMPEMNGFEFLKIAKKKFKKRIKKTKIIMVTSSNRQHDIKQAFKFPEVQDYVLKPMPDDFLENLILDKEQALIT